jgi:hypothetical protein
MTSQPRFSFREDLKLFHEQYNCLLPKTVQSNSESKVILFKYKPGKTQDKNQNTFEFNSLIDTVYSDANKTTIIDNPIEYRNTLDINPKKYTNMNLKLLTYIYIPNEAFYRFRVNNFTKKFNIYLNNWEFKILDDTIKTTKPTSTTFAKISNFDIIKQGIYMICIELENNAEEFKLLFQTTNSINDKGESIGANFKTNSLDWVSINNLLLDQTKCNTIDKKYLIDIFVNPALQYCNTIDNTKMDICKQFYNTYNDLENTILNTYLEDINSIYPTPINGRYSDWDINNTEWEEDLRNDPIKYGTCGFGVKRERTRTYINPRYGGELKYGDKLNTNSNDPINNNYPKYKNYYSDISSPDFTQTETMERNIYCFPDNKNKSSNNLEVANINDSWEKLIKCNTKLDNNTKLKLDNEITLKLNNKDIVLEKNKEITLDYLRYLPNMVEVNKILNSWSKSEIQTDLTKIDQCYKKDEKNNLVSSFLLTGSDKNNLPLKNIFYPNISYTQGFELINGDFIFKMQTDGNLVLYYKKRETSNAIWQSNTKDGENNNNAVISMQTDGNIIIYDSTNKNIKSLNSNPTAGDYVKLLSNGLVVINDTKGNIKEYITKITLDFITKYYKLTNNYLELTGGDEKALNDKTCIYPYIKYSNDFYWENDDYKLVMQNECNLVSYKKNNESVIWKSGTDKNEEDRKKSNYLLLNEKGNLLIYWNNGEIWKSDTVDKNVYYGKITKTGYLALMKNTNNVIKAYPEIITEYLIKDYWNKSPWSLFTDRNGKVWKGTWGEINKKDWDIDTDTRNCTYCNFRGWWRPEGDGDKDNESGWNVTQRDLTHVDGYDKKLNGDKPVKKDDSNNYNSRNDRNNFYTDQNGQRKPPQLEGGIEKPNYIPGYDRISYTTGTNYDQTHKFLIMDRGNDYWKQAFVLYRIKSNKYDFATDIIKNNRQVIKNIINNKEGTNKDGKIEGKLQTIIKEYVGEDNFADEYPGILKQLHGIDSFTNKNIYNYKITSNFTNKLNNSILENFQSPICNIANILTDPNCNSPELKSYKNYIQSMNNYCENKNNSINPICLTYYNKEFIDKTNLSKPPIKPDVGGKLYLLSIQENICKNSDNYLNNKCVELNYSNPEVIKSQGKFCLDPENKDICDQISEKYKLLTELTIVSDENGNVQPQRVYSSDFDTFRQFEECKKNNNDIILTEKCNLLMDKESQLSDIYKDELKTIKDTTCIKSININNSACIKDNTNKSSLLSKIKDFCINNKDNKDCKQFCETNKTNTEFKKTDYYKELCQPWIEKNWWVLLLIIIVSILGGGFFLKSKFSKKKSNNSNNTNKETTSNNDNNDNNE